MLRSRKLRNDCSLIRPAPEHERDALLQFSRKCVSASLLPAETTDIGRAPSSVSTNALADFERAFEKGRFNTGLLRHARTQCDRLRETWPRFRFTEHAWNQGRSDTEKVANGVAIVMVIERRAEQIKLNGMETAEIIRESGGGFARGFVRDAVHFAAIARGEDESFMENAARASSSAACRAWSLVKDTRSRTSTGAER